MTNLKDIYWLAGLLEGEGCFGVMRKPNGRGTFFIALKMNDKDIVFRARTILKAQAFYVNDAGKHNVNNCAVFETRVHGSNAIAWMMTLYPLMGVRRKAKIRDTVIEWLARRKIIRNTYIRALRDRAGIS